MQQKVSIFILSIVVSYFFLNLEIVLVYSISPIVKISPECGEIEDHRVNFTGNGFNKNGNIYWEFVNSTGELDYYGYFDSNGTGGFNDYTIADGLKPDKYTLRFFDDRNNDYVKDSNASEVVLNYQIPCNS